MYRIKRLSDGLYSTGGMYPKFNKAGKVWLSLGDIRRHLTVMRQHRAFWMAPKEPFPYHGCYITVLKEETILMNYIMKDDYTIEESEAYRDLYNCPGGVTR